MKMRYLVNMCVFNAHNVIKNKETDALKQSNQPPQYSFQFFNSIQFNLIQFISIQFSSIDFFSPSIINH